MLEKCVLGGCGKKGGGCLEDVGGVGGCGEEVVVCGDVKGGGEGGC